MWSSCISIILPFWGGGCIAHCIQQVIVISGVFEAVLQSAMSPGLLEALVLDAREAKLKQMTGQSKRWK